MSNTIFTPNYDWNVIDEKNFKDRVHMVFNQVAGALVNTLGPYGSTTIIEKYGEMHITKDGWQVLKKIHFGDPVNNNIMHLLINISAQVVLRVGDGSTSSIIAANTILNRLENNPTLKKMRPKEFLKVLSAAVELISQRILDFSSKINKENDPDFNEIYKLAMISTNGDDDVSKVIQTIYRETVNPSIEFVQSKTNKTTYEIIEGYKLANMTYIDGIFANGDDGTCSITKPIIIMFDHKIDKETHFDKILTNAIQVALAQERRIVIVAPNYDKYLLNMLGTAIPMEYKARGTSTSVYARVSLINNMSHELYNDFATMTGGMIIRETHIDQLVDGTLKVDEFLGEVDNIVIGDTSTLIKGFYKRNEDMYNVCVNDATAKYKKVEATHRELGIVNSELYELKQRLAKLRGKMGVIYVGGNSSLEKVSNYDLVEDAVKACESAYNYGYNIGGNLILPIAIRHIKENTENLSDNTKLILDLLNDAFRDVFVKVLGNKFTEERDTGSDKLYDIVDKCVDSWKCYDLITDEYSDNVINSCFTDIEILKAATSIVSLLISSNQYVSIMVSNSEVQQ